VPSVKDLARTVVCLANAQGGKIPLGVDLMYEQMLRLGKEPPWFIPDELSVRVVIRDGTFDEPFVAFVQRWLRTESPPTLEHLLVLRHLKRHLELDLATAAELLQRNQEESSEVLAGLVRQGLLERIGAGKAAVYQLTVETAEEIGVSSLGRLLTPAEQEARVLTYVQERGQITNRGVNGCVGSALTRLHGSSPV